MDAALMASDIGRSRMTISEVVSDWLPVERDASLAGLAYIFARALACQLGAFFGELLSVSLVVGIFVVCALAGAICLAAPVSAPASMALVLRSAVDSRNSSVAALAHAYGIEPNLPSVDFPGGSSGNTATGWLVALAAVILAGYFTSVLQRCCFRFLRRVGVGALRVLVDVDNGLAATRGYWDRLRRRLGVIFRHLAAYAVVGGLMFTLTSFLVSVAPVGGTPTYRQLNSVALIMDSAPLLGVGEGRLLLDAFTTARYDVSIAVAPSSFASGINTLELAESLGLET